MAIAELDDGRMVVTFVTPDGPADQAGIAVGAEILEMNGEPMGDFVEPGVPYSGPFGTASYERLQQLRYATRAPEDAEVPVTFQNPDAGEPQTATLAAEEENESFRFTSFLRGVTGTELPVEFELLPRGHRLRQAEQLLRQRGAHRPALGDDDADAEQLRHPGPGHRHAPERRRQRLPGRPDGRLLLQQELELGNAAIYDEERGDFYADPNRVDRYYLPDESLRYPGAVSIIVGPQCLSACEFFAYDMTLEDRAQIVGHYPTGGAGGPRILVAMPDGVPYQVTIGRAVDMDGNIHIEGKGVPPTVRVPVTEETVFYEGDALLDAAIASATGQPLPFGAEVAARVRPGGHRRAGRDRSHDRDGGHRREAGRGHRSRTDATETTATAEPAATEAMTETTATAEPAATEAMTETTATAELAATEVMTETAEAPATPEAAAPVPAAGKTATITTSGGRALVRQGPSGLTPIVGAAANGNAYAVLEISGDGQWVRIDFGPDGGWVASGVVKVSE